MYRIIAFALATVIALIGSLAHGQEAVDADRRAEAGRLFKEGGKRAQKKDWAGAYNAFLKSFELRESHDTAANLGQASLKLERYSDAARYLAFAYREMPTSEPESRRNLLKNMLEESRKRVTAVHVVLDPRDAEVLVDGASRGPASDLADPIFLDPGEHTIGARADGYAPAQERIVATPGAERTLSLKLTPSSATPPDTLPRSGLGGPETPPPHGSDPTRNGKSERNVLPVVLVGGGVALVAAGIGIGFLIASNGTESDANDLGKELDAAGGCGAGTPLAEKCAARVERYETADRQRNISTIGFVTAGVAALGTVAYVLLTDEPGGAAASGSAQPVTSISRDGFSIGLRGAF